MPCSTSTKRKLHIDLETYSSVDIKNGVYKYAESEDFEILLFAYSYDDDPVTVIECGMGEPIPQEVMADLTNPDVLKVAHNAQFERVCLSMIRELFTYHEQFLDPEQWWCTMVHCIMVGYPGALAKAGPAMGLAEQELKLASGTALINYFSRPCKPTKANGYRTRNLPKDNPEKWRAYVEYNRRDVVTEKAIDEKLSVYPVPERERKLYALDQRINDLGVLVDTDLVAAVRAFSDHHNGSVTARFIELTGVNPKSVPQVMEWFKGQGLELPNLQKGTLEKLSGLSEHLAEAVKLKLEISKTSITKYKVFENATCVDHRIRGLFQFYGSRTGRFAGRLVQPQNLPRNAFDNVDDARVLVKRGCWHEVENQWPSVNDVFATLIRTVLIGPGTLSVADYSAIEARVIAWLAGEKWRIEAFDRGADIYCESASRMFGVPVQKDGINRHLRKKGKVAELALGYSGGVAALKAFGADAMGMTEREMRETVAQWREASPAIVKLWQDVDRAAKHVIRTGKPARIRDKLTFRRHEDCLAIDLPSGRSLYYLHPGEKTKEVRVKKHVWTADYLSGNQGSWIKDAEAITPKREEAWADICSQVLNPDETPLQDMSIMDHHLREETYTVNEITFMGTNQITHKFEPIDTFGGKLVENIVQAIARDCLCTLLTRLDAEGFRTVMHVHDEVIVETDNLDRLLELMAKPPEWAPDLRLKGAGFTSPYYRKD